MQQLTLSVFQPGVLISLAVIGVGLALLLRWTLQGREVDRRVIFAFIFVSVATPVLFPITFEVKATPIAKALFEKIESLPEGTKVMISYDFDPAMAPEVLPMANAVVRHCFQKNHKLVFIAIWATGQSLLNQTLQQVVAVEFPEKQQGIDWCNLGYKAGNEGVMNVIVTNLKKMFPTDVNSTPLEQIEILEGIQSCRDFALIVSLGGGQPGPKEWILYVGDPGNVPIGAGTAAVSAPQLYAYYPKQLIGLLGGVKGAAEYEFELMQKYERFKSVDAPGIRMMGPQTLAHVVIIAFIMLGNVAYLRTRRKKGGAA
ncbi:MAG: hypothetical protein NDJ18_07000 [candidate division Zixibacteria bacterium]|nr:hypothetical protein [candidate division Zixibacteria bacterium]